MADYNIQQKVLNSGGAYDNLYPKSKADLVDIADTAGHFTATNVEGALAETAEQISTVSGDVVAHKENITSSEGRHGIRFYDGKLDVKDSGVDKPYK